MNRAEPYQPPLTELDFSTYLTQRVRHFTGRRWIEAALDGWLADPAAPRYFILTGSPGIGKSAFAARLVTHRRGFLHAHHFCYARAGMWNDPIQFSGSVARQLAARIPEFASAVAQLEGIHINAQQHIQELKSGSAINVWIQNLIAAGAEESFHRFVQAPLTWITRAGWNEPIVDILSQTRDMPDPVRFVLTSRAEDRVLRHWDDVPYFLIAADGPENMADIREYVAARLVAIAPAASGLLDSIVARSAGNFLYASHLMDAFERNPDIRVLENLPEGLDGVYRIFLGASQIGGDITRWDDLYLPVIGVLSVAQEPLTEPALIHHSGLNRQKLAGVVRDLWQYLALLGGDPPAYRIYHQSFVDFLTDRKRSLRHWVDPVTWHQRIAGAYFDHARASLQAESPDDYGLRYIAIHLAGSGSTNALFALVEDDDWRRRKYEIDASGAAYAADVEQALLAAARGGAATLPHLFALAVKFAIVIDKFANASEERLGQLVAEGNAAQAFSEAQWIGRPVNRAVAYRAIAVALVAAERPDEARLAWRKAVSMVNLEGNPGRAAAAGRSFCQALFAQRENGLARECLLAVRQQIARIPDKEERIGNMHGLAAELIDSGRISEAKAMLETYLSEAEVIWISVIDPGHGDPEDRQAQALKEMSIRDSVIPNVAALAGRSGDRAWSLQVLSRLEKFVETHTEPKRIGPPLATIRSLRAQVESGGKIDKPYGGYFAAPGYLYGGGSARPSENVRTKALESLSRIAASAGPPHPVESGGLLAAPAVNLERISWWLAKDHKTVPPPIRGVLEDLRDSPDEPTLQDSRRRIEEAVEGMHSDYQREIALSIFDDLGGYDNIVRLLPKVERNRARADAALALVRAALKTGGERAEFFLEQALATCSGMWAKEQTSRVVAGVALAFDELGLRDRVWELIWQIAYEDIRMDAAMEVLWTAIRRAPPAEALQNWTRVHDLAAQTTIRGEAARGLLVLAAAAARLGRVDLLDAALSALRECIASAGKLTRAHGPESWDTDRAEYPSLVPSHALAALADFGRTDTVFDLLVPMSRVIDVGTALLALAQAAAESGDPERYRQILRWHAGFLEVEPYAGTSESFSTRVRWHMLFRRDKPKLFEAVDLTPQLPQSPTPEQSLRWLKTALLASRYEGSFEVWRHIRDFSPLLCVFPSNTAEKVLARLLATEGS